MITDLSWSFIKLSNIPCHKNRKHYVHDPTKTCNVWASPGHRLHWRKAAVNISHLAHLVFSSHHLTPIGNDGEITHAKVFFLKPCMFRNCEKRSFVCCAVYMNIGKLEKWESCPLIVLSYNVIWDNVVKLEILKDAVFVYATLFAVQQTTHVHFKGVSRRNPCNALHFVSFTLMSPCQFFLLRWLRNELLYLQKSQENDPTLCWMHDWHGPLTL